MPDNSRKALLVLGMHRSGTSLLSGLIAQAGIDLGKHIMPPAEDNPKGFWENQQVVDLNERILNHFGQSWSSWEPLPDGWATREDLESFRAEIANLLSDEFSDHDLLSIKDPRLCRLLPLWREVFDQQGITPCCAYITRPVTEVAASLHKRDGLGTAHAEALWLRYHLDLLAGCAGLAGFHVRYDDLLRDPAAALASLSTLIDRELTLADDEFVDADLKHHGSADTGGEAPWALPLTTALAKVPPALDPGYEALVFPLLDRLVRSERELSQVLVNDESLGEEALTSAREQRLFNQAEEARTYALSMEQELKTGRSYIGDMEKTLAERQEQLRESHEYSDSLAEEIAAREQQLEASQQYADSLGGEVAARDQQLKEAQTYARSLSDALEQKEKDLKAAALGAAELAARHEEDVARREEYTQSLIAELEKTRQALNEKEQQLTETQQRLEEELRRFRHLRRLQEIMKGKPE